ncbi:reverse transcriptase domain-containing protein [Tanacetum coccineum]|uniref:Reverse transcriptase domain-containing protein n=1 Tax=Tanacetum coccineum TaxID=301880 RepID=A0ABQ5CX44_9ASTR
MAPKRATRSTPVTENPTTTTVTNAQLQAMIDQGVTAALTARDANRNGDDSHTSGTGARRTERVTRECTYQDFMKCQPLYFKGTEGVVELTQWFERMETVFRISNCSVENQIKFSTCTLLAGALTWWNSHVRIVGHDVAYAMTWIDLRKKMTDKYCPRNEIKKLETELWNLKVKGTNVTGYNQRFQELALLCVRMFPEESDKVERYVGGLPDMIHGGKLNPKYVGPSKVMETGGSIAYKLERPQELSRVHNTFQVSNLRKCYANEPLDVPLDELYFDNELQVIEEPIEIMDREVKRLRQSRVPLVKVRWNSRRGPEFTWEREDQFKKKYPHLFSKAALVSSAAS